MMWCLTVLLLMGVLGDSSMGVKGCKRGILSAWVLKAERLEIGEMSVSSEIGQILVCIEIDQDIVACCKDQQIIIEQLQKDMTLILKIKDIQTYWQLQ
ncbi:hypothetical protein FGO68_gene8642 [Halteria grandinella]|uniref:Uncharacterized protein n=1 Tax=Halteria grandinella TaxID=5974 RepID=A0A8J8NGZ9_HALGN|nr:hypothetical protein FGO68_gene8642 [Halteria grandinella]